MASELHSPDRQACWLRYVECQSCKLLRQFPGFKNAEGAIQFFKGMRFDFSKAGFMCVSTVGLLNLVEHTAIGKVRFVRLLPAAKHFINGEEV